MLTWTLWRSLLKPAADHPIFQATLRRFERSDSSASWSIISLIAFLGVGLVVFMLTSVLGLTSIGANSLNYFVFIIALPFVFFLLRPTLTGLLLALRVNEMLLETRQQGRYDLLCLLPVGELSTNWLMCAGYIHNEIRLEPLRDSNLSGWLRRWLVVGGLALLLQAQRFFANSSFDALPLIASFVITVGLFLRVDNIQSLIIASLIAMLAPTFARSRFDARLGAFGVFMGLQLLSFGVITGVGLTALSISSRYHFDPLTLAYGLPLLLLITFAALREGFIALLWRSAKRRLHE